MWYFKSCRIFNSKTQIQAIGEWNNLHWGEAPQFELHEFKHCGTKKHAFVLHPVYITTEEMQLIILVSVACDTDRKQKERAVVVTHRGKEKCLWKENTVRWKYYTRKSILLQEQRNIGIDSAGMLYPQNQDTSALALPSRSHAAVMEHWMDMSQLMLLLHQNLNIIQCRKKTYPWMFWKFFVLLLLIQKFCFFFKSSCFDSFQPEPQVFRTRGTERLFHPHRP